MDESKYKAITAVLRELESTMRAVAERIDARMAQSNKKAA